jgi:Protein of unknown function DUF262
MTIFSVSALRNSSVAYLYRLRESIQVDPAYQRQGEVWSIAKQRLLIDSIINQFDIPKFYFHEHAHPLEIGGRRIRYSLIDGRQRLEAIWDFIDGKFALGEDFRLLETNSSEAAGKTFSEIEWEAPEVTALFSATSLDVMLIRTDDIELIEEMFSRLNEAAPLNAAEKRNGRGGPLRPAVRSLVDTPFFTDRLPFRNDRFRHYDLATKFLYWGYTDGPSDTKKRQLDEFWEAVKRDGNGDEIADRLLAETTPVVEAMAGTFVQNDTLLSSIGMVSVYYLLYRERYENSQPPPTRSQLASFDKVRRLRRFEDEDDLSNQQFRLLEFDRLSQSPNDQSALQYRLRVLRDYLDDPTSFSYSI